MDAANGTEGRAWLEPAILAVEIFTVVSLERYAGAAALLRAPAHQAIFTHVEVAGARSTVPVVGLAPREILLESVVVREVEGRFSEPDNVLDHPTLAFL